MRARYLYKGGTKAEALGRSGVKLGREFGDEIPPKLTEDIL